MAVKTLIPLRAVVLSLLLAGCSVIEAPHQLRGNKIAADVLKDLVPGTSTRADATALLGSPSAKATFDDNTWIYISATTQTRVARTPGVTSQDVTVLTFDQGGVLRGVKKLDQDASLNVDVVSRTTPSPGSDASFLQQLLGNVGKFNAGAPSTGRSGGPGSSGGQTGI